MDILDRSVQNERLLEHLDEDFLAALEEYTRICTSSWDRPDAHRTWAHARRSLYEDLLALYNSHVQSPQTPEGS